MQSRCPYFDCKQILSFENEFEWQSQTCIFCNRPMTVRSLARHQEIDKQLILHEEQKNDSAYFFSNKVLDNKPVAIIEEIRSLWNVGSIFRTADGAGFNHLFLVGITGCPPRKEISKTSLGAENHVSWSYSADSLTVISKLKEQGYFILGLEKITGSKDLKESLGKNLIEQPVCLVVGNEVKGIYSETLESCDLICELPMKGFKESLNVAVAFGIASYLINS